MNRQGAVLIEVLVAVAILTTAGLSLVELVTATGEAQRHELETERELYRAEKVLTATVLLRADELNQRIGVRQVGDFLVRVDRPEPDLFRIGVSPISRPRGELLATLVYRRGEPLS